MHLLSSIQTILASISYNIHVVMPHCYFPVPILFTFVIEDISRNNFFPYFLIYSLQSHLLFCFLDFSSSSLPEATPPLFPLSLCFLSKWFKSIMSC